MPLERRGRIAIERRADGLRQRDQIDVLGVQHAVAISEMMHAAVFRTWSGKVEIRAPSLRRANGSGPIDKLRVNAIQTSRPQGGLLRFARNDEWRDLLQQEIEEKRAFLTGRRDRIAMGVEAVLRGLFVLLGAQVIARARRRGWRRRQRRRRLGRKRGPGRQFRRPSPPACRQGQSGGAEQCERQPGLNAL